MPSNPDFWHDKLHVYQRSLAFVSRAEAFMLNAAASAAAAVLDHLDRASESVAENIVDGNSRWSAAAKCHYFGIALGSILECAACLDVYCVKGLMSVACRNEGKEELRHITRMLVGLMRSHGHEFREAPGRYETETEEGAPER